jgi:hypothetical protein
MTKSFRLRHSAAIGLLLCATGAFAQADAPKAATEVKTTQTTVATPGQTTTTTTTTTTHEKIVDTGKEAGHIASQPARDVGVQKVQIPPAVQKAAAAPYSLAGLGSCVQLGKEIHALNDALGPDYAGPVTLHENKAGKLAAEGGQTLINTLIPFRGLVREVSGAAPAERRLDADIKAAFARRGFLRGVATARKCRLR